MMHLAENDQNLLKKNLLKHRDVYARSVSLQEVKPEAFCRADVIRNLIWSVLHDQHYELLQTRINVIFYNAEDESGFEQCHVLYLLFYFGDKKALHLRKAFMFSKALRL